MTPRPNSLLLPDSGPAWARIAAAERADSGVGSVEARLLRGQALSAQAAALRRAVSDGAGPRA